MIELVVLGATLTIAAAASGARARRRVAASRALERYATWRAHAYVPAPSAAQSPRVEGTRGDVAFTIDVVKISGRIETRVRARVSRTPSAKVAIVQRGALARALASRAEGEVEVGLAAFDRAYALHGVDARDARAWLDASINHLVVLEARSGVWLASDGATVTLTWSGVETSPLVLDAARELAVSLAHWHRPELPYR